MTDIELTQTNLGHAIDFKGKRSWGESRKITIDREWSVSVDGVVVGYVRYALITREDRSPGKRYVNSRWQSPGWQYTGADRSGRWLEAYTKADAISSAARTR